MDARVEPRIRKLRTIMKVVDQETGEDLEAKQKAEADQQPREAAAGGE